MYNRVSIGQLAQALFHYGQILEALETEKKDIKCRHYELPRL